MKVLNKVISQQYETSVETDPCSNVQSNKEGDIGPTIQCVINKSIYEIGNAIFQFRGGMIPFPQCNALDTFSLNFAKAFIDWERPDNC